MWSVGRIIYVVLGITMFGTGLMLVLFGVTALHDLPSHDESFWIFVMITSGGCMGMGIGSMLVSLAAGPSPAWDSWNGWVSVLTMVTAASIFFFACFQQMNLQ